MALATNASVRLTFGFDQADSFRLFQLADDAALTAFLTAKIAVASAWLAARSPGDYPPADANKLVAFTEAENYLTAAYAVERLKTLKVTGTHFPYVSEDSDAYHNLIETDYHERVRDLLLDYVVVDTETTPFVLPTFSVGAPVNTAASDTWEKELSDVIDETRGLVGRS